MKFHNQVLSLHSEALPPDTLMVQRLVGQERLSGLFRFELDLICTDRELDLERVLYAPAKLGIKVQMHSQAGRPGTATREIAGMFEEFEELDEGQGWTRYRAVLVPKLWTTTRTFRSRIFQDVTIDELLTAVLQEDGLAPGLDFELRLERAGDEDPETRPIYPKREYVVQYEESDWQFLARWLEREGIYFYFVNEDGAEKVVFADTGSAYAASPFGSSYPYRPESQGEGTESDTFTEEEIRSLRCRQTHLPAKVAVNDYNWRSPGARLLFSEDLRDGGTGEQTEYNDHFKNEAQGKALLTVRKEELACRAKMFYGTGSCRAFRPGSTFELAGHFRNDFNRRYLLVEVTHTAEQMISLESATVTGVKYANSFVAIPDDRAWRPERTTEWPSIKGVMHAKVDGEGDGTYAELDEYGRYKLKMPFDEHSDTAAPGKASRWVRMAQPYAGRNSGMHFPLLKGTEVLIVHIDGDPDRPVIVGAVPNPETESPTTGSDYTRNTVRTASGNLMKFDDNRNASGFVFADGTGSRVCDYRWRIDGSLPGTSAGNTPGGGSGTGRTGGRSSAVGINPLDGDPVGEIVSTIWDEGIDTLDGASVAWKAYFKGDGIHIPAVDQLADKVKRFTDDRDFVGLSSAHGVLSGDTTLNEANIVSMFNELVKDIDGSCCGKPKTRYDSATYTATESVEGTALSGKIGKLVQSARNFEAMAAGSTIGIDVGDTIKVTVGDQFEYTDASYDVKIGTGGYSREETRGDEAKDTYRWGDSHEYEEIHGDTTKRSETRGHENEWSYFYGRKEKWELEASGSASIEAKFGGHSENTVNGGVFEKFELHLAGVLEIAVLGGGKVEIELGSASCKLGYTTKSEEFELFNERFILREKEVFLDKVTSAMTDKNWVLEFQKASLTAENKALKEEQKSLESRTLLVRSNLEVTTQETNNLLRQLKAVEDRRQAVKTKLMSMSDESTSGFVKKVAGYFSIS